MLTACDDEGAAQPDAGAKASPAQQQASANLEKRCEALGKACGEQDKHRETITKECKEAVKSQVDKNCAEKALAAYDCYEKEFCGKKERIWVLDDFRVLSERHKKCADERSAVQSCIAGAK